MDIKCEYCSFLAKAGTSLEVHSAGMYSGSFECALSRFAAKYEDNLNKHLNTCETFTCSLCIPKLLVKNVLEVTTHSSIKHTKFCLKHKHHSNKNC